MSLSVVILAAGQGKRMNSELPKVLQPLAGKPLLAHVVDTAARLSPAAIAVVYGHGGECVRETLHAADVDWVLQAEQLGTGHAVMQAVPSIPDDHLVLVLYGDVPLIEPATLQALVASAGPRSLAILTAEFDDPAGYGRVIRDTAGRVVRIVEHKDAGRKELAVHEVNTGLIAAPAVALKRWLAVLRNDNAQREYYLTDCVIAAVRDGFEVVGVPAPTTAEVQGVNDKIQLAEVEAALRHRRATALMRSGVTLADPARFDQRGEVIAGRDVFIDVNVVLCGRVSLGDRAHLGPGCVLRDCSIGPDTVVHANSVIEEATVGAGCVIGPFARLRPGAQLSCEVHIGNFVEVKNSQMGDGSKANHLAYVGDATVGARVNIGAGTIVANYDGANKHRTVIGDDAHTGSNSVLVAPISIGAGATVGAGSTVTKTVPPGRLTVARARQVTVEGWQRPRKQPRP
jgi:bifunctional UDP-N-acetylglucosamine pyrophosphorylase/glucosamine-1-phosphate N-acetyltransferase